MLVSPIGTVNLPPSHVPDEETSILLYSLLQHNHAFRIYILSRTDAETLLLPVLQVLCASLDPKSEVSKPDYHHIYTLLLILLQLSADDDYTEAIQRITLTPTPLWFTDRVVKNISLGGLAVLVLVRIISLNLSVYRDLHIQETCLAVLGNLCSRSVNMHSAVAQRLVM